MLAAAGGINTSYYYTDVGFAVNNPALVNNNMHGQLSAAFNAFFSGIQAYQLAGAYYSQPMQTTFAGSVFYINYGNITGADAAGNINGSFRPVEYAVQFSAARQYLQKWHYGATVKYIHSSLAPYYSNAIAVDGGVMYKDTAAQFYASLVVKNLGAQIKSYTVVKEDLPFDLQVGITKKLKNAPLAFSLTAHHLHSFKLAVKDSATSNNSINNQPSTAKQVLNHVVVATHVYVGNNLEGLIGYNFLRRAELNDGNGNNGLNGFSAGVIAKFKKLHLQYARAYYQKNITYNQFALTVHFVQLLQL